MKKKFHASESARLLSRIESLRDQLEAFYRKEAAVYESYPSSWMDSGDAYDAREAILGMCEVRNHLSEALRKAPRPSGAYSSLKEAGYAV